MPGLVREKGNKLFESFQKIKIQKIKKSLKLKRQKDAASLISQDLSGDIYLSEVLTLDKADVFRMSKGRYLLTPFEFFASSLRVVTREFCRKNPHLVKMYRSSKTIALALGLKLALELDCDKLSKRVIPILRSGPSRSDAFFYSLKNSNKSRYRFLLQDLKFVLASVLPNHLVVRETGMHTRKRRRIIDPSAQTGALITLAQAVCRMNSEIFVCGVTNRADEFSKALSVTRNRSQLNASCI